MREQLQNSLRSFLNFTLAKKRQCFKSFTEGQKDAYILIPYLLHTSEPKEFGYVDGILAPCGIHNYKHNPDIKRIGKKYFSHKNRFEEPKTMRFAPIEALSIMGSAGSIAQTEGSDLDYWVTIKSGLSASEIKVMQRKFTNIENWCWNTLDAEVHFFMSTAETVYNNNFGSIDKESCGTALGKLLKEEYYRTSLQVMGKIPLWWLAPYNANDKVYASIPGFLSNDGPELNKNDFVDFGNIRTIPNDEFVGGGMWQLNKGVGSPFKSALKMALLVEYSDTSKPRDLLAQMLKRLMLENANDMEKLDPYRMMVERVISFYQEAGDTKNAKVLQICLFLKMETRISRWYNSTATPDNETVKALLQMVKSWRWHFSEVQKWENFDHLSMTELVGIKRDLEDYMFISLKRLRASSKDESRAVTSSDFRKMTQRLATVFNPDPERTEWFYPPYARMIQSKVYSIKEELENKTWAWNLYPGVIDEDGQFSKATAKKQLRSEPSLPELITWMLFNQLIRGSTKLHIDHRADIPFSGNLMRLSGSFYKHIGIPKLPSLDDDAFANDSYPLKWMIVVNLVPFLAMKEEEMNEGDEDEENSEEAPVIEAKQKTNLIADELAEALNEAGFESKAEDLLSNATDDNIAEIQLGGKTLPLRAGRVPIQEDPFNAGPDDCSIYQEVFLIELNSWGELFAKKMPSKQPAAEAIRMIVEETVKQQKKEVEIYCEMGHGPYHLKETHGRFVELIEDITKKLVVCKSTYASAIFQMNGEYNLLTRHKNRVDMLSFEQLPDAIHHANLSIKGDTHFYFDHHHPRLAAHHNIYKQSRKGENLLHLMENDEGFMVSCIDQTGCYIFDAIAKEDFADQWPALLISFLSATRTWTSKEKQGKARIVRQKEGEDNARDMTDSILAMLTKMKSRLPRTQIHVDSKEGLAWLKRKRGNRDNASLVVEEQLEKAIELHKKSEKRPFILSSIRLDNREDHAYSWAPSIQLQFRQCLIRKGRRMSVEEV